MSYWQQMQITDALGNIGILTAYNELRIAETHRLAGNQISGTVVDPNFWTTTLVGSGSATQAGGQLTLATGATANSSTTIQSGSVARYAAPFENHYQATIQLGDAGATNNVRRWGAFNGTDGCYFKLSGTTINVCTMNGGMETAVPFGSWNGTAGPPTLTVTNFYEIYFTVTAVAFLINGTIAHLAVFVAAPWASTPHLPVRADNTNSGGGASNLSLSFRTASISRFGPANSQPKSFHGTTAATTVLKYAPGSLHKLIVNQPANATVTFYDNTAGSGAVIAIISAPNNSSPFDLEYQLPFQTGLTVVSTGTWDFTVVYE